MHRYMGDPVKQGHGAPTQFQIELNQSNSSEIEPSRSKQILAKPNGSIQIEFNQSNCSEMK